VTAVEEFGVAHVTDFRDDFFKGEGAVGIFGEEAGEALVLGKFFGLLQGAGEGDGTVRFLDHDG